MKPKRYPYSGKPKKKEVIQFFSENQLIATNIFERCDRPTPEITKRYIGSATV
ncbi:hypothetical protein [Streptococcus suis]|uniref:hypothetical protein n=1 Tax=Streptococcus suis TaxID=1307 RepID=UPI001EDEA7AA|nr:hypothetical protein [Streptococcus suis]